AVKDTVVVSSYVVEEPVDNTVNTEDVNVGQTPTSPNVNPKPGTSYANLLTTGPSRNDRNFCTLFTLGGNGVDMVVSVESIRAISTRFANTNLDVNLLKEDVGNVPVWFKLYGVPVTAFSEDGLSAIATKIVRADVELKDTIVVAMPKLTREGFYTCTVRVEYEWKPPRCTCCKVFGHTQEECPKNPCLGVAKILNKPSHDPKGVLPTANISGNKKKGVEPTKEVSNSNPIDGLNSVDNDGELGTNGGTSNLASNGANSSGSSFWNVETSSTSTTPIVDKIGKIEKLIMDEKVTLVDDDGIPLKKVNYPGDHDSEDERDSYENGDYDEDPYDDDMYEGQDIPNKIQDICDNLDIRVRCRRKK
ncbi:hypothetical protein Tco_1403182, partial [Tanacetum coccineum]